MSCHEYVDYGSRRHYKYQHESPHVKNRFLRVTSNWFYDEDKGERACLHDVQSSTLLRHLSLTPNIGRDGIQGLADYGLLFGFWVGITAFSGDVLQCNVFLTI
jgi:hypothetical protein